jgi:hypothetical protein
LLVEEREEVKKESRGRGRGQEGESRRLLTV